MATPCFVCVLYLTTIHIGDPGREKGVSNCPQDEIRAAWGETWIGGGGEDVFRRRLNVIFVFFCIWRREVTNGYNETFFFPESCFCFLLQAYSRRWGHGRFDSMEARLGSIVCQAPGSNTWKRQGAIQL